CDTDSFPEILGTADEALNILPRIYSRVLISASCSFKHQLSGRESGGHRIEAGVAYPNDSYLEGQESIEKIGDELFTIRLPREKIVIAPLCVAFRNWCRN